MSAVRIIPLTTRTPRRIGSRVLLIGPYDPKGGEYTFLAPPLGVWRLAGVLRAAGVAAEVFDPNCCAIRPDVALAEILQRDHWDIVGISTTGMTLPHDLELAHVTRRVSPTSTLVAGGMEATFNTARVLDLGQFDLAVLGEGEEPLVEIASRLSERASLAGIPGTAWRQPGGELQRLHGSALTREGLKDAIFKTPYEEMPYGAYWDRLERSYRVGELPLKAEREARLAEIRSVRLITLNYCPMGCTFCASTNFLNSAQGSTVGIGRLDEHECLAMIRRILSAHPAVRTIVFQDDIFVFTNDRRVLPLCEGIVDAKRRGDIPADLQFISTNRIDAMTPERLAAMRRAGFRVLGFGVESFALGMLREFNKAQIHPHIAPVLNQALTLGITPFLDMILTSPRCSLDDLAENICQAFEWICAGCEVGMYPYVVPFSGAAMATDPTLVASTVFERRTVAGADAVSWNQGAKILPMDRDAREAILEIEATFEASLRELEQTVRHLPSRVRSLVWISSAIPHLERRGCKVPWNNSVGLALLRQLPQHAASRSAVWAMVERRAG
jgi:radical SAM superfamily enzyme YgiQ (UPF0313 family)